MRLWHIKMIPVLPREQLVAQWRELSAIAGSIENKGIPNHVLVNFINDYSYDHFISYAAAVKDELISRGYHPTDAVWNKITSLKPAWSQLPHEDIYKEKMNDTYLKICYYNLYEKYLCGGIKQDWWNQIDQTFDLKINN